MIFKFKNRVSRYLANLPGWRTNRKIVVFESDDWGSNRTPSPQAFKSLLKRGIRVDQSYYNTLDTLENRSDLESLFSVLLKYQDSKGNNPIFTFNVVMGNPSFELIRENKFQKFIHEDLFTSYRIYHKEDLSAIWEQAMSQNLIRPQFHAREHLNTSLWMEALRNNHRATKIAFVHKFWGLNTDTPSVDQKNYLAAYWAENKRDFKVKVEILKDGLRIFRELFGYTPESFVACNYVYPKDLERYLYEEGVKYIQTQRGHLSPDISLKSKKVRYHYTGQRNSLGQCYLVRNCTFEPSMSFEKDMVHTCLNDIKTAFRMRKPAIISTHRINYVSGLSQKNQKRGALELDRLIGEIILTWPEVEFLSSDALGQTIEATI